jgi:hypothetical protein
LRWAHLRQKEDPGSDNADAAFKSAWDDLTLFTEDIESSITRPLGSLAPKKDLLLTPTLSRHEYDQDKIRSKFVRLDTSPEDPRPPYLYSSLKSIGYGAKRGSAPSLFDSHLSAEGQMTAREIVIVAGAISRLPNMQKGILIPTPMIDAKAGVLSALKRPFTLKDRKVKPWSDVLSKYNLRVFDTVITWCHLEGDFIALLVRPKLGQVIVYDCSGSKRPYRLFDVESVSAHRLFARPLLLLPCQLPHCHW